MNLGILAMKRYYIYSNGPELDFHHLMQFFLPHYRLSLQGLLPLQRCSRRILLTQPTGLETTQEVCFWINSGSGILQKKQFYNSLLPITQIIQVMPVGKKEAQTQVMPVGKKEAQTQSNFPTDLFNLLTGNLQALPLRFREDLGLIF